MEEGTTFIRNCLNIRYTPLRDDDLRRYCGNLPVTYCSPMDHGNVLPEILLDSCRKTFKDKLGLEVVPEATTSTTSSSTLSQTAVITVSHGDGCEHFWGHLHARIAEKIDADFPGLAVNTWCYVQTLRKVLTINFNKNKIEGEGRSSSLCLVLRALVFCS